jgi:hypothetical protein
MYLILSVAESRVCNLVFNVSGPKAKMVKSIRHPLVRFESPVVADVWRSHILKYDVGIVTLSPGGATVCLPSKVYAMMGGGLAIIEIFPAWSDLAKVVVENNAGWVINNSPCEAENDIYQRGDTNRFYESKPTGVVAEEFAELVIYLSKNYEKVFKARMNAWKGGQEVFAGHRIKLAWQSVFEHHNR